MSDTSPEVMQRYRAMLLARSPEERLKMGLIRVEPLGPRVEYRWMADFVATVDDGRLRDRLKVALDGRGAFRRFKNVLVDFPAERERWFAVRGERLRAAARAWLADHEIEPTTAPLARHERR